MSEELTGEDCNEFGMALLRTSADDVTNPYNAPVVTCPNCPREIQVER
ncbi:hypothetical protein [Halostagnicola kamekurae]|uniref:Uncharacterized protein n=1 Tax=Halostagnicola kamekurae TaxID=619731 RepID=A0A1I6UYA4_9EURY|nr:hypothetical protein [Halostagnicola kamekurae]SFT06430.1 hypothetical protein SAMN04488556_4173 [Halostagnicola kamekurae]